MNGGRQVYCGSCGSIVQSGDRFCGVCGAGIPPDAQDAAPTREIPTLVQPSPTAPASERSRTRPLVLAALAGALLVLLVGAGSVALTGLGPGAGLLGGSADGPTPSGDPDASGGSSIPPDAPPDPAFDLPLQALMNLTDAPIMLPAELPNELKNVGVEENLEGDSYGIAFLDAPPEDLVGSWPRYKIVGSLRAVPEQEHEQSQGFRETSSEDVRLPDGTQAELRRMEPVSETANYGPQWEGTFTRDGYAYTLSTTLGRDGKSIINQALSTMVLLPGSGEQTVDLSDDTSPPAEPTRSTGPTATQGTEVTPEDTTPSSSGLEPEDEDQVREAVEQYYYAVDGEEWAYTYFNLDSASKALFAEEEWAQKNQFYADNEGLSLDSMSVVVDMEGEEEAGVTVYRDFTDGTSITRETEFVWEDGWWRHHLTEEEKEIFMPGVPYEEFVEAQQ